MKNKKIKKTTIHWRLNRSLDWKSNRKAFTLIELIVVMVILGVLASLSLGSYSRLRDRYNFENALTQMAEMVKTARNYAMTNRAVRDPNIPNTPFIPKEGYGVFFNTAPNGNESNVVLFANSDAQGSDINQFDSLDIILEQYKLPSVTVFEKIYSLSPGQSAGVPDTGTPIGNTALILFRPPLADTLINNNLSLNNPNHLSINTLSLQLYQQGFLNEKKMITINKISGFPTLNL